MFPGVAIHDDALYMGGGWTCPNETCHSYVKGKFVRYFAAQHKWENLPDLDKEYSMPYIFISSSNIYVIEGRKQMIYLDLRNLDQGWMPTNDLDHLIHIAPRRDSVEINGTIYHCRLDQLFAWNPFTGQKSGQASTNCKTPQHGCIVTDGIDKIYIIHGRKVKIEEYSISMDTITELDASTAHLIQDKNVDMAELCAFWDGYLYVFFSSKTSFEKQQENIYVYNIKEKTWEISETKLTEGPIGPENNHMIFAIVPFNKSSN